MEIKKITIKGNYRDILKGKDNHIIFDSGWNSNTIVNRCRILLASFMKKDPLPQGIQKMAVGQGEESWDNDGAPSPDPAITKLFSPLGTTYTINESDVAYLDNDDCVTRAMTNRLQVTVTLGTDDPPPETTSPYPYPLREFGIFGRLGEEDYMINFVTHPVIYKDSSTTLIRVIRLYF